MSVHNHGPAEGRGLDCAEVIVNGELKGWCLRTPSGADLIAAERARQVAAEGWTSVHDDAQPDALALAAATYALPPDRRGPFKNASSIAGRFEGAVPASWPWTARYWKPTPDDRLRELVKAGALVAAEIDRISRSKAAS